MGLACHRRRIRHKGCYRVCMRSPKEVTALRMPRAGFSMVFSTKSCPRHLRIVTYQQICSCKTSGERHRCHHQDPTDVQRLSQPGAQIFESSQRHGLRLSLTRQRKLIVPCPREP